MKGCAYYKLIVEKGDLTQAFKVPMRPIIQKTWTLLTGGNLAFRLLGNREKSAFMFSFHVNLLPAFLCEQIFIERDIWPGYEAVTIVFNKDSFLANTFFSSVKRVFPMM